MHDKVFFVFGGGALVGILIHSLSDVSFVGIFLSVLLGVGMLGGVLVDRRTGKRVQLMLFGALFFFSVACGLVRFGMSDEGVTHPVLDAYVEEEVVLYGVVSEEPVSRESSVRMIVDMHTHASVEGTQEIDGRVIVTADLYPQIPYGSPVRLEGVLRVPESFTTETGREFDYKSFLDKDGIGYQMFRPRISESVYGNEFGIWGRTRGVLFAIKHSFLGKLQLLIPEPHVALLGGLLVGAQESLGDELLEVFRVVGLIHIVVLSGYNVTIIAESIQRVLRFLPRQMGLWLGALSIVLFVVLTGASATIVRAGIMALLVLLGRGLHRRYSMGRALGIAGFLMVMHNPKILVFDPSFQLSFIATLGLIYVAPLIEVRLKRLPNMFGIREIVTTTLATQLVVLPLLLYMTASLSVVALPVNILVLSMVPFTMLVGFLAGIFAYLALWIAFPFALLVQWALSYILFVVELFAQLPGAAIKTPHLSIIFVTLWYLLYVVIFYGMSRNTSKSPLLQT